MKTKITSIILTLMTLLAPVHAEKLSSKELKAIGEKYVQAWNSSDIDGFNNLLLNPDLFKLGELKMYKKHYIEEIELSKVKKGRIYLKITYFKKRVGQGAYGDCQKKERIMMVTSDGKIKYDDIIIKHPVNVAKVSMRWLRSYADNPKYWNENDSRYERIDVSLENLKKTGIPMFDLDLKAHPNDIHKSLDKIESWLKKEGDEYDNSEPIIFLDD